MAAGTKKAICQLHLRNNSKEINKKRKEDTLKKRSKFDKMYVETLNNRDEDLILKESKNEHKLKFHTKYKK